MVMLLSVQDATWPCVEITKPEPTMSHGGVFHLRIVRKYVNFKTQTSEFSTQHSRTRYRLPTKRPL